MERSPATPTLHDVAHLLQALNHLTADPQLQAQLGPGLLRELRYPCASFRQRFPDAWPSAQPSLF